jgi:histidine triad (HIT) family protein
MEPTCIFCRIVEGRVPSTRVYEDELCVVIRDIRPQAPVHLLVLPRTHVQSLWELDDEALAGRLLSVASRVARSLPPHPARSAEHAAARRRVATKAP